MKAVRLAWITLLLAGCPYIGPQTYEDNVMDADGDGGIAVRFGGSDCQDDNPAIVDCDEDGDGVISVAAGGEDCDDTRADVYPGAPERCDTLDNDCNGAIDNDDPQVQSDIVFYADADGDGAGDPNAAFACQEYADPANTNTGLLLTNSNDCDDTNAQVNPNAGELCDGFDNNCDGNIDDVGLWFEDLDNDGFGVDGLQVSGACDLPANSQLAASAGDCDDSNPDISPSAEEVPYDGIDDNCNGGQDDWDVDNDGWVPAEFWGEASTANSLLDPGNTWYEGPGDCNDTNAAQNNGAPEVCDGIDNDCDGLVDIEDLQNGANEPALSLQVQSLFTDLDGDGYAGTPILLCPADVNPAIHLAVGDDCYDDMNAPPPGLDAVDPSAINPGTDELCDNLDNDCDGRVDWALTPFGVPPEASSEYFRDEDGDGFGATAIQACGVDFVNGIALTGNDCDDTPSSGTDPRGSVVYPGAPEVCGDTIRQDCSSASVWDCDGDGFEGDYFGNGADEDCNDDNSAVFPTTAANAEVCDGIDNDCDGLVDSADTDNLDTTVLPVWYPDLDEDGWGDAAGTTVQQCDAPAALASILPGDCDDNDPAVNPDAPWYQDADGDGFGTDASATLSGCIPPAVDGAYVWVRLGGDCNDSNPVYSPATAWLPDADGDFYGDPTGLERFCNPPSSTWVLEDGNVDCNDSDPQVGAELEWFIDTDNDGWGDNAGTPLLSCGQPAGYATIGDCNDNSASTNPEALELCNGDDDDCDGLVDDNDPNVFSDAGPIGYLDSDGDGFGQFPISKRFCVLVPAGWTEVPGDCDDTNNEVFPGQTEVCTNGIDDDCDGVQQTPSWYLDADDDGFGDGPIVLTDCNPPPGPDTYATSTGDCNDAEPATYPGAVERDTCDTIDDNCDGIPEPQLTWYFDQDGDGYGDDLTAITTCVPPLGAPDTGLTGSWVLTGGDCDDDPVTGSGISFGRIWYIDGDGDGLGLDSSTQFACPQYDTGGNELFVWLREDINNNGQFDPGDDQLSVFGGDCDDSRSDIGLPQTYYVDADADSWGSINLPPQVICPDSNNQAPAGFTNRVGDCADVEADRLQAGSTPTLDSINPDGTEVLGDGEDNDCDGLTDQIGSGINWYTDADGDGLGGNSLASYAPGAVTNNADCDDGNAAILNGLFVFIDLDLDGFGEGSPFFEPGCTLVSQRATIGGDCDDSNDLIQPGVAETCDGIDNDCDGLVDDGVSLDGYADLDLDGEGDPQAPLNFCTPGPGISNNALDCDDTDPLINTSATEVCDGGVDNDCNPTTLETESTWTLDADGDGFGGDTQIVQCAAPGPQWLAAGGDCDDSNSAVNPNISEVCNSIDDNCDGNIDEGVGTTTVFADFDLDGFTNSTLTLGLCPGDTVPFGYRTAATVDDCDDNDPTRSPGLAEVCGDGIDNDCQAGVDDIALRWADADLDSYGNAFAAPTSQACADTNYVDNGDDCDDGNTARNPGAVDDTCDLIDNDCNGIIDDAVADADLPIWYVDGDGDSFGDTRIQVRQCVMPAGFTADSTDCDDTDPSVQPGASEQCDGLDTDCNGIIPANESDADLDGWMVCAGDCDDNNVLMNPNMSEICDGQTDNNCSGDGTDVGDPDHDFDFDGYTECQGDLNDNDPGINPGGGGGTLFTWYFDNDGDGYGDPGNTIDAASSPGPQYTLTGGDCNDNTATANPAVVVELCDGIDNNCDGADVDGLVDAPNPYLGIQVQGSYAYAMDFDGDGDFSLDNQVQLCQPIGQYPTINVPAQPSVTLAELQSTPIQEHNDCNDNDNATFDDGLVYAPDGDGDGVPAPEDLYDAVTDCLGGPPFNYAPVQPELDCDGTDPLVWRLSVGSEYADFDGDGAFGRNTVLPGSCVGLTDINPGDDCNDFDPNFDPSTSSQDLYPFDQIEFDAMLATCATATIYVDPTQVSFGAAMLGGGELTIRSTFPQTCYPGDTFDCMQGLLDIPANTVVNLEQLGMTAAIGGASAVGSQLNLTDTVHIDAPIDYQGAMRLFNVNTFSSAGSNLTHVVCNDICEINGLTMQGAGTGNEFGLRVVGGGGPPLSNVTAFDLEVAVDLVSAVDLDFPFFDLNTQDIRVGASAYSTVSSGTFSGPSLRAVDIADYASFTCDQCTFAFGSPSSNSPVSVGLDASVTLTNSTIGFTGSGGSFIDASNGFPTIDIQNSNLDLSNDRGLVQTANGTVTLTNLIADQSFTGTSTPLVNLFGANPRVDMTNLQVNYWDGVLIQGGSGGDVRILGANIQDSGPVIVGGSFFTIDLRNLTIQNVSRGPVAFEIGSATAQVVDSSINSNDSLLFSVNDGSLFIDNLVGGEFGGPLNRLLDVQSSGTGPIGVAQVQSSDFSNLSLTTETAVAVGGPGNRITWLDSRVRDSSTDTQVIDISGGASFDSSGSLWQFFTAGTSPLITIGAGSAVLVNTTLSSDSLGPMIALDTNFVPQLLIDGGLLTDASADGLCKIDNAGGNSANVVVRDSWVDSVSQLGGCGTPMTEQGFNNDALGTNGDPNFDGNWVPQNFLIRTSYGELKP